MSAPRGLPALIEAMREEAERDDLEGAHRSADDLLAEAIQSLSAHDPILAHQASELLQEYGEVGKWYA